MKRSKELNNNMLISESAEKMGESQQYISIAIKREVIHFGCAVKMFGNRFTYDISRPKFSEYTRIPMESDQKEK